MAGHKIAFIGAGKMGLPVCKRLKAAGNELRVLVRKPEQQKAMIELGFTVSSSVAELARGADVVFTCVSDDQALSDVMLDAGFNAALSDKAICIDMSTVSPAISEQIALHLPKSVRFLRSPVSGSTGMAEAGTLTALVSGPKSAFEEAAGIFSAFTKKAFHLGENEEARYLKLGINSMVAATSVLLGEALALGLKGGLSNELMLEVIGQSAVASPLIAYKKDMIVSGNYSPAATLNMLMKDLSLYLDASNKSGVATPVGKLIHGIYSAASKRGLGEKDFFVLVEEAAKTSTTKAD